MFQPPRGFGNVARDRGWVPPLASPLALSANEGSRWLAITQNGREKMTRSGFITPTPSHWGLPWRDTSAVISSERSPADGSRTVRTHGCTVGKDCAFVAGTQGVAPWGPETHPESARLRRHPLDPTERSAMARRTGAVSVPEHLLAAPPGLGSPRRVAEGVARVPGPTGCPRPTRLG
jgi:hypothetical protein